MIKGTNRCRPLTPALRSVLLLLGGGTMSTKNDDQNTSKDGEEGQESATVAVAADLSALLTITEHEDGTADEDDEDLFKHPPKEECPLCFLPLPNDPRQITYYNCCGKKICSGCHLKHDAVLWWTNEKRAAKDPPEPLIERTCAFCRGSRELTAEEHLQNLQKRMALNDARAFYNMAFDYLEGELGLSRDEDRAVELFLRAAELGSADACYSLASRYCEGGSLGQDSSKELHYLRLAAKRGHVNARWNLGIEEYNQGNDELAVKHWVISAAAGHEDSLKAIGAEYRKKSATKDQFEEAIRANHKAKKEMSSDERKMAKKATVDGGGFDFTLLSADEFIVICGIRKREDMLMVRQWWNQFCRS